MALISAQRYGVGDEVEGIVNRHFIYLKAAVLIIAIGVAGISTGFRMDRLATRFDSMHYSAVVQASATMHCASHSLTHAIGKLWGGAKQALVLSD